MVGLLRELPHLVFGLVYLLPRRFFKRLIYACHEMPLQEAVDLVWKTMVYDWSMFEIVVSWRFEREMTAAWGDDDGWLARYK